MDKDLGIIEYTDKETVKRLLAANSNRLRELNLREKYLQRKTVKDRNTEVMLALGETQREKKEIEEFIKFLNE